MKVVDYGSIVTPGVDRPSGPCRPILLLHFFPHKRISTGKQSGAFVSTYATHAPRPEMAPNASFKASFFASLLASAFLHHFTFRNALLAHGFGVCDQGAIDLDSVLITQGAIKLHKLGENTDFVLRQVDLGVFLQNTAGFDGVPHAGPGRHVDAQYFLP